MLRRESWLELARKLDWELSYVRELDAFPPQLSGEPWLSGDSWRDWDEPFKTSCAEYVAAQAKKEAAVRAVRDSLRGAAGARPLDAGWWNALKLHAAVLPLAEFAAVVGNLRSARFGRDSAWRAMSTFGALDEIRHTQIPLWLMHERVREDVQFDWTHRFFHTNCWVAIAARHFFDELLLCSDAIEFAIATHFVFETGFTNLQFVALSSMSDEVGDDLTTTMLQSIQTDEARHAQIGRAVLEKIVAHDRTRAQELVDKWFWRSWQLFALVTGLTMDYLTPLEARRASFREFVEEWVLSQFLGELEQLGLERPWYWDQLQRALPNYHHMAYASAYTYRATVWFDFVLPGPREREWLRLKYPTTWPSYEPIWERIAQRWSETDPGVDLGVHGTAIVGFCDLCQLVLCSGTPERNDARVVELHGRKHVFCSEPCERIFAREPQRYAAHAGLVQRVLRGEAPGNLLALLSRYCDLRYETWGKDAHGGEYAWLTRDRAHGGVG